MFLKHKSIQVIDDCVIHRDVHHEFEFVSYSIKYPPEERIIVRIRCITCNNAKLNGWDYYRVSADYWIGFLLEHKQVDFTSAN